MEKPKLSLKQRIKLYTQRKPNYLKEAKAHRYAAAVISTIVLLCSIMGLYIISEIGTVYKSGLWTSVITQQLFDNVSFLSVFSAVALITMGALTPVMFMAFFFYIRSLNYRIRYLEDKLEAKA